MSEPKRLYGGGSVGMIVVLDSISLEPENPFAKYSQPAFFTIVEDLTPERRFNGDYVLQDSTGNRIRTVADPNDRSGSNVSSYLTEVNVWAAWKAETHAKAIETRDQRIERGLVRVAILKDVLVEQGFRLITTEQAAALGIKP